MKKGTRVLCAMLACLLCVGLTTSCGDTESSDGDTSTQMEEQSTTHFADNEVRSDYIIKDGQANYTVVMPQKAEQYEEWAAKLLVEYYQKATGVTLRIITDNQAQKNGKYISVGYTTLFKSSGIAIPESEYGADGFRVVTKGNTVYISGAHSMMRRGTYYGVQEFLKYTINWRAYTRQDVFYDKKTSVPMYDFNVVEIPDFYYRRYSGLPTFDAGHEEYSLYLRYNPRNEDGDGDEWLDGISGHSHYEILPPSEYFAEHPDWYYVDEDPNKQPGGMTSQLCLTNEEMIAEFIQRTTRLFVNDSNATFIHIGQMDSSVYCKCDDCLEWIEERNTNFSGLMVWFTNQVARGVVANMQKIDPSRTLTFQMFSYLATTSAPTREVVDKNGNKSYQAHHPDVIPDDNVFVQIAPLLAKSTQTMEHVSNENFYKHFKGWGSIANLSTWMYGYNDSVNVIRGKMWDVITHDLRFFKETGVKRMYYQGNFTTRYLEVEEMNLWIVSRLMWDTSLNWRDLEQEFVQAYYGELSDVVQEYLDYAGTYEEKLRSKNEYYGSCYFEINKAEFWSYSFVEGGRKICEQGMTILEEIKKRDYAAYEKYYTRFIEIYLENIYMQLDFHMDSYSKEHCRKMIEVFSDGTKKLGVTRIDKNSNTVVGAIEDWEVQLDA